MESRRLRLILLAYLRGYLKPHESGVRSKIREELILHSVSIELDAEYIKSIAMLESSFAVHFDKKQLNSTINNLRKDLLKSRKYSEFYILDINQENVLSLEKLYYALKQKGFLG